MQVTTGEALAPVLHPEIFVSLGFGPDGAGLRGVMVVWCVRLEHTAAVIDVAALVVSRAVEGRGIPLIERIGPSSTTHLPSVSLAARVAVVSPAILHNSAVVPETLAVPLEREKCQSFLFCPVAAGLPRVAAAGGTLAEVTATTVTKAALVLPTGSNGGGSASGTGGDRANRVLRASATTRLGFTGGTGGAASTDTIRGGGRCLCLVLAILGTDSSDPARSVARGGRSLRLVLRRLASRNGGTFTITGECGSDRLKLC